MSLLLHEGGSSASVCEIETPKKECGSGLDGQGLSWHRPQAIEPTSDAVTAEGSQGSQTKVLGWLVVLGLRAPREPGDSFGAEATLVRLIHHRSRSRSTFSPFDCGSKHLLTLGPAVIARQAKPITRLRKPYFKSVRTRLCKGAVIGEGDELQMFQRNDCISASSFIALLTTVSDNRKRQNEERGECRAGQKRGMNAARYSTRKGAREE